MTQALIKLKLLKPIGEPYKYPLKGQGFHNISIELFSTFRKKENHSLHPLFPPPPPLEVYQNQGKVIWWKILGLLDFWRYRFYYSTLEFKVYDHPNLKVNILTLKIIFFKNKNKNWYCFYCLDLRCQQKIQWWCLD